jgi:hypothetical protein
MCRAEILIGSATRNRNKTQTPRQALREENRPGRDTYFTPLKTRDRLDIKKGNIIDQARKRMFAVRWWDTRPPPALQVQIHLLSPRPAATTVTVHPPTAVHRQGVADPWERSALWCLIANSCRTMCAYTEIDGDKRMSVTITPITVVSTDKQTNEQTPWPLVRERTIPTERQKLVDEI